MTEMKKNNETMPDTKVTQVAAATRTATTSQDTSKKRSKFFWS